MIETAPVTAVFPAEVTTTAGSLVTQQVLSPEPGSVWTPICDSCPLKRSIVEYWEAGVNPKKAQRLGEDQDLKWNIGTLMGHWKNTGDQRYKNCLFGRLCKTYIGEEGALERNRQLDALQNPKGDGEPRIRIPTMITELVAVS